jgi:mannose-6-phosphate isomerase-like protein (cupin superfamily)
MASILITGPLDGEPVDLGTTKMRILHDGSGTDGRLGIAVSTLAPHTEGPPQHLHRRHDEGFYVISGTARFSSGEVTHDAPAGSLVVVPPQVAHTFANPGDEPMVMLSTFTPAFYVQYFRDMAAMIAGGQPVTPESVGEIMARYSTAPAAGHHDAG